MRTSVLLAALLAGASLTLGQDFEKTRTEFKQAVLAMNADAVRTAAQALAASDNREAVDALLDGYGLTANQIKQLWAEKVRWIREADANSVGIEWDGNMPTPSSIPKIKKLKEAQQKGKEVEERIMRVEAVKRGIVAALATFKGDAAVKELISKLKNDSNWDRRAGVAEALGLIAHADTVAALLEQLKRDSEAGVRVACIEALGAKKADTPEVVTALCDQLKSDFWQVACAAGLALKAIGSRDAIEPLIEALKAVDGRLKLELNAVLAALTGVDKHGDYAAWRGWFDANKDAVKAGTYQPKPEERAGGNDDRATTFYGIPVTSKNVIFVIDHSGSMEWDSEWKIDPKDTPTGGGGGDKYGKPDGKRKIDIVRWQLKRCLSQLADGTEFNIIFFQMTWKILSEKMVKLGSSTRKQAIDFVDKLKPEGGTNIFDPVEKALSFAGAGDLKDKIEKSGVDTIFLLTDGMPNSGQIPDAKVILTKLKEMNRLKKVVINTIGAFTTNPPVQAQGIQGNEKEEGLKFLQQLAQDHGGTFVDASR